MRIPRTDRAAIRQSNRENTMNGFYTASRIYAGFMGIIILGGILWFSSTLSGAIVVAGTVAGFSSLAAALIPKHKLSSHLTRQVLVTLCVIGIGTMLVLVTDDLTATRGIEWDVVAMKAIDIMALATMASIALRWSSGITEKK